MTKIVPSKKPPQEPSEKEKHRLFCEEMREWHTNLPDEFRLNYAGPWFDKQITFMENHPPPDSLEEFYEKLERERISKMDPKSLLRYMARKKKE